MSTILYDGPVRADIVMHRSSLIKMNLSTRIWNKRYVLTLTTTEQDGPVEHYLNRSIDKDLYDELNKQLGGAYGE